MSTNTPNGWTDTTRPVTWLPRGKVALKLVPLLLAQWTAGHPSGCYSFEAPASERRTIVRECDKTHCQIGFQPSSPLPELPPSVWGLSSYHSEARLQVLDPIEGFHFGDAGHVHDRRITWGVSDEITEPLRLPNHLHGGVFRSSRHQSLQRSVW